MKTLVAALVLFTPAFAADYSGRVVDIACKGKDLAAHTRKCALDCAKSGFGLVVQEGPFYKFDEAGNAQTLELLKKSKKDHDLLVRVTGTKEGGVLKVESIAFVE